MTKLIMTVGLPASGKSTWAKEYIAKNTNFYIVEKDSLRDMVLGNLKWTREREKTVVAARNAIIFDFLKNGKNVICSDTNLAKKHVEFFRQEIDKLNKTLSDKIELVVQSFLDVDVEECIKRDFNRAKSVGKDVILEMYYRHIVPECDKFPNDNLDLPECIIVDLDGTLAAFGDKNPFERDFINDEVTPVKDVINGLKDKYKIIIFSGRSDKYKEETELWLAKNAVFYHELHMRSRENDVYAEGMNWTDTDVKFRMLSQYIQDKYRVAFIIDDRPKVVRFWREWGFYVFNVNQKEIDF